MALSVQPLVQPQHRPTPARDLVVGFAATREEVRAVQRLRYQVFAEEMGARLLSTEGLDEDRFDRHCHHLTVRDRSTGAVVGCYRILTDTRALEAGGYYSQSEFDLTRILGASGRFMEVGRSCVHPDYRSGATIALLWSGLARFIERNHFDYVMGCASIPLSLGAARVTALSRQLAKEHASGGAWHVHPKIPLPDTGPDGTGIDRRLIPPLLKAYLRLGARICGEAAWDPEFNTADLFILLGVDHIRSRYNRHFFARP